MDFKNSELGGLFNELTDQLEHHNYGNARLIVAKIALNFPDISDAWFEIAEMIQVIRKHGTLEVTFTEFGTKAKFNGQEVEGSTAIEQLTEIVQAIRINSSRRESVNSASGK